VTDYTSSLVVAVRTHSITAIICLLCLYYIDRYCVLQWKKEEVCLEQFTVYSHTFTCPKYFFPYVTLNDVFDQ